MKTPNHDTLQCDAPPASPCPAIRPVAPEDLAPGQAITLIRTTYEYVNPVDDAWPRTTEPRRVTMMSPDAGRPLKVLAVCVPFVLVRDPSGAHRTVDLRRNAVALLSADYASESFKKLRPPKK